MMIESSSRLNLHRRGLARKADARQRRVLKPVPGTMAVLVWGPVSLVLMVTAECGHLTLTNLARICSQQAEHDHCKAFVMLYGACLDILLSDAGWQKAAQDVCAAAAGPCTPKAVLVTIPACSQTRAGWLCQDLRYQPSSDHCRTSACTMWA